MDWGRGLIAGVTAAAGAGAKMFGEKALQDMKAKAEMEKEERIREWRNADALSAESRSEDRAIRMDAAKRTADKEDRMALGKSLSDEAGLSAAKRPGTVAADIEASSAGSANSIAKAVADGTITQEDADVGLASVNKYRNDNMKPSDVTTDDFVRAGMKLGLTKPEILATLEATQNERQAARTDRQTAREDTKDHYNKVADETARHNRAAEAVAGVRAAGTGGSDLKERQFNAKEWSSTKEAAKKEMVIDVDGKTVPNHGMRSAYQSAMDAIRGNGDYDPSTADTFVQDKLYTVHQSAIKNGANPGTTSYDAAMRAAAGMMTKQQGGGAGGGSSSQKAAASGALPNDDIGDYVRKSGIMGGAEPSAGASPAKNPLPEEKPKTTSQLIEYANSGRVSELTTDEIYKLMSLRGLLSSGVESAAAKYAQQEYNSRTK